MIKSFCTGVKHRTVAGSTDGQILFEHMFKSQATKKIPDTPRRHRSRNDTAPERNSGHRSQGKGGQW